MEDYLMTNKRVLSLFLAVLLLFPASALMSEEDEDLSIEDIIEVEDTDTFLDQPSADGSVTITVTCTGDLTIGGDNLHKKGKKFYDMLEKNNKDISFTMANVRDIFRKDDLTLVNFEGTFTNSKFVPDNKKGNQFIFNIDPEYVTVLSDNSIEAVSLENNHVMDHGQDGYDETKEVIRNAGVVYSNSEEIGVINVKGIQIAMLSYLCIDRYDKPVGGYNNLYEKVAADIAATKEKYPIVIVSFCFRLTLPSAARVLVVESDLT